MTTLALPSTCRPANSWQFAEFVMRTSLRPELAEEYQDNPREVLARFGLALADDEDVPELPARPMTNLVIASLERSDAWQTASACICAQS